MQQVFNVTEMKYGDRINALFLNRLGKHEESKADSNENQSSSTGESRCGTFSGVLHPSILSKKISKRSSGFDSCKLLVERPNISYSSSSSSVVINRRQPLIANLKKDSILTVSLSLFL